MKLSHLINCDNPNMIELISDKHPRNTQEIMFKTTDNSNSSQLHSISIKTLESTLNTLIKNDNDDLARLSSMIEAETARMSSPVDRFREYQMYDSVNSRYLKCNENYMIENKNSEENTNKNDMSLIKEPLSEIATISFSNVLDDEFTNGKKKKNKNKKSKKGKK
jgi:hypothetical protein